MTLISKSPPYLVAAGGRSLAERYKSREVCDMVVLSSKEAAWDPRLASYVLNFRGRANQVIRTFLRVIIFKSETRGAIF